MADEKLELLLNAALEATPQERERSNILEVGFDQRDRTWEVIVKYHGSLLFLEEQSVIVEELLAGYAILTLPEEKLQVLSETEQIEYVEKPKSLYFQIQEGLEASCVLPVTLRPPYLSGEGVLIGIVDSGIDYRHPAFQKEDGSTRIRALWDQSLMPRAENGFVFPQGFSIGAEFTKEELETQQPPVSDTSGHGTAVAGIAAGTAPASELLIVKLRQPAEGGFPRTTELMRAVAYLVKKAVLLEKPIAVNISFGNTYGSHDGSSLLERFLDNASEVGRTVICVGSGNEGAAMGHAAGKAGERVRTELQVGPYQGSFSVQLWKHYADVFEITLRSPGGAETVFGTDESADVTDGRMRRIQLEETEILLYIGEPTPYSVRQEIYLDFLPGVETGYVNPGIWTFELHPRAVVTGSYSFYLPSQSAVGTQTRFYRPETDVTLTIPSTAAKVITVGAYDAVYNAYADFSGRGYVFSAGGAERNGIYASKPDLAAPGVNIVTALAGGGYGSVSGTSFAAPFVTGAAALLMEWGITQGNDAYLYGQKVKAYLIRGAGRDAGGLLQWPNPQLGWGTLCVADSIPSG